MDGSLGWRLVLAPGQSLRKTRFASALAGSSICSSSLKLGWIEKAWVVFAPAGYGKTVLAAHYLTERKRAVLWYRIDDRDMDPGAFFHRLREAAIQYGLQGAETLPALTAEYAGGEQAFVRNFVEHLLAEAPVGFTLVLDDFQQLPESAPLQDLIPALFESSPSACNIFVLSRHDPAASLARLRANRCIGVLPETALRFDESETAELVAAWPGIEFGQFPVKALQARMQGWAAGLVLTLERHGEGLGEGPVAPDTGILFDYFAAEVVGALSRQERDLLLVTALPSHFDACLARELSGNPKASELIQALLRRNFFVYQEGNTYRYHPLFRDYLLRSAELDWDAETLAGKRLDAARRLLDGQEREMALPLFRDAADWESFVGLIVELAPAMMEQGRYKELERWLQCVPELGPEVPPWIDFWLATSRLPTDYATSYELYSRTYDQFMSQGNTLGAVYSWIGAVDAIIFSLSVVSRLDRWLQQLETLLSDTKVEPDNPLRGQLASRVMTILTLRYPEHPELPNWLAIAEQTLDRIPEINQRTMSAFYLCTYYIWRGDLDLAADLIQRIAGGAREIAATRRNHPNPGASLAGLDIGPR
jgi:LuxR family transcriptional regulator, maltose regulon positive regulatory protein